MGPRTTVELDASVFGLPSFPFRQRFDTRMQLAPHMMSAHRRATTSLARSAVAATVNTNAKYNGSVKDRRIMSVCCGVIVIAVYVDFTPFSRQPSHGFEATCSSNNPYSETACIIPLIFPVVGPLYVPSSLRAFNQSRTSLRLMSSAMLFPHTGIMTFFT